MATDTKGNLYFFDTDTFLKNREYSGLRVNMQELVGSGDQAYIEPL